MGFVGLIICLTNIFNLYHDVIANPDYNMTYILTYRLLQDHIENFFSAIRNKGGFCNNPSVEKFESAYKNLLLHHQIREAETGNCAISDVMILSANDHSINKTNSICNLDTEDEKFDEDHELPENLAENLCSLGSYVEYIVSYIGGFIVSKLLRRNICAKCKPYLLGDGKEESLFSNIKSKTGALKNPSKDVTKICQMAERIFRQFLPSTEMIIQPSFVSKVVLKTNVAIAEEVFTASAMKEHYLKKDQYIRQKLNKLILFKGQL